MEKDILENKIAIIGAGHIGQAFVEGFINSKKIKKPQIIVASPNLEKLKNIKKQYGIVTTIDNKVAVENADLIIICVKPLVVKHVLKEIDSIVTNKIILSVAAGITIKKLQKLLGKKQKIVRLMPNLLVSQNKGVIGFYCNNCLKLNEINWLLSLLSNLGNVIQVKKEEEMEILTLISGCGPAISAYFINLLLNYGKAKGIPFDESLNITLAIFDGTLSYLKAKNIEPKKLISLVATKGGVTEEILQSFDENDIRKIIFRSMNRGYVKIKSINNNVPF